jgi:hypothetical protein
MMVDAAPISVVEALANEAKQISQPVPGPFRYIHIHLYIYVCVCVCLSAYVKKCVLCNRL